MRTSHATTTLPATHHPYARIDLQKDKKTALLVNGAAAVVMAAMALLAHFCFVPITALFSMEDGFGPYLLRFGALMAGIIAYVVLHEATHGATMKYFGATKLRFGFTGLYAYAGSEVDYFDKHAYLRVALAPLVVWFVVFTALLALAPPAWFWVVYFLQMSNVSGAAGDVYVTVKCRAMPEDILVMDTGVDMTVYSAS